MSEEARKAGVFSCEYSEQNPVYCQQCGGHEHLCRKPLSDRWCEYANHLIAHGNDITALSMRTNLLAAMNAHADHTAAIREHLQWKDVADGLPEVSGLYLASIKGRGLMVTGFAVDSDSDKWLWKEKYDRYIPYPIPEYKVNEGIDRDSGLRLCTLNNLLCKYPDCPKGHKEAK